MMLDYGNGGQETQVQYVGLWTAWTWASGATAVPSGSLVGQWSNVIQCQSANERIDVWER